MYVNPFWLGVLVTVGVEVLLFIWLVIAAIIKGALK